MTAPHKVHIGITISTSTPTISLSQTPSPPFQLITTARIISSPNPSSPVTLCTDGTPLDNGNHSSHDGLFLGAFTPLRSLSDPARSIQLAFVGSPNYGSRPNPMNLRQRSWSQFETIPPTGHGVLEIRHELSLERMFRHEHNLKVENIEPGERFRVQLSPRRIGYFSWWAFGDLRGDLASKKFLRWTLPDEGGEIENLMPGEIVPDVERTEMQGWVFSERLDGLEAVDGRPEGCVFEFVA